MNRKGISYDRFITNIILHCTFYPLGAASTAHVPSGSDVTEGVTSGASAECDVVFEFAGDAFCGGVIGDGPVGVFVRATKSGEFVEIGDY